MLSQILGVTYRDQTGVCTYIYSTLSELNKTEIHVIILAFSSKILFFFTLFIPLCIMWNKNNSSVQQNTNIINLLHVSAKHKPSSGCVITVVLDWKQLLCSFRIFLFLTESFLVFYCELLIPLWNSAVFCVCCSSNTYCTAVRPQFRETDARSRARQGEGDVRNTYKIGRKTWVM
jgi:hypothetical protein